MRLFRITLFLSIIITLFGLGIYLFTFSGGLSYESLSWYHFGTYLTGIASLVNVFIFISITIILKKIDTSNKEKEIFIQNRNIILNRFLDSYESMTKNLHDFRSHIIISKESKNYKNLSISEISKVFNEIKFIERLLKSYLLSNEIIFNFSKIKEDFSNLIGSLSLNKETTIIDKNINKLAEQIDSTLNDLNEKINAHLSQKIKLT